MVAHPHFLIFSDDEACGRLLKAMLCQWGDATVARAVDVDDARLAIQARTYSAAFFDVRLEPECGLDLLAEFRSAHRNTPAMVLTGCPDRNHSVRACELGAQCIAKPISLAAIEGFIHTALPDPFSDRERDVIRGLLLGQQGKVIAFEYGIAESSIRAHIRRAKAKVNARSRRDLLEIATRLGVGPRR